VWLLWAGLPTTLRLRLTLYLSELDGLDYLWLDFSNSLGLLLGEVGPCGNIDFLLTLLLEVLYSLLHNFIQRVQDLGQPNISFLKVCKEVRSRLQHGLGLFRTPLAEREGFLHSFINEVSVQLLFEIDSLWRLEDQLVEAQEDHLDDVLSEELFRFVVFNEGDQALLSYFQLVKLGVRWAE